MRTISEKQTGGVRRPRWLRGHRHWLAVALGVLFFFTPLAARMAGVQPKPIENRPLARLPGLSRGFGVFGDLTQWSIDHLPLRNIAVRLNTRLSEDLFGQPPVYTAAGGPVGVGQAPTLAGGRAGPGAADPGSLVVPGHAGWLFIADEFVAGCRPGFTVAQVTDGLRRLDVLMRASGRTLVATIAPDKDTVDPSFVDPHAFADTRCAQAGKQARWQALGALGGADFVDLLGALQASEGPAGQPAFLPTDSHWTDRSAATVFLPGMLNALDPRLYRSARVAPTGPEPYTGDLSILGGSPQRAVDEHWSVTRPGVHSGALTTTSPFPDFPITHVTSTAGPGEPLVGGHTLVYGDSFTERALDKLTPFFADLTRVPEISRGAATGRRAQAIATLLDQVRGADVVVVEQSERIVAGHPEGSLLAPDVLDALAAALAGAPRGHGLRVG